jgi:hypothetical protein
MAASEMMFSVERENDFKSINNYTFSLIEMKSLYIDEYISLCILSTKIPCLLPYLLIKVTME